MRYGKHLSLLMLDIDHFKRINDGFGHQVGDQALRHLAEVSRSTLREVDLIGRLGGEEFAVLLPETGRDEAGQVAERLREAVARSRVLVDAGASSVQFTVSIGVASMLATDDSLDRLLDRADEALYAAKHAGRNRVCVASV